MTYGSAPSRRSPARHSIASAPSTTSRRRSWVKAPPIGSPRVRPRASPGSLVEDIGPDAPLAHAFAELPADPCGPQAAIEHPDRRIIRMQQVVRQNMAFDPFDQRQQQLHGAPAPVGQRAVGNIRPHAGEDLVQPIKRQVVIELGDQDVGQQ